jgi:hypothetical protein
MVRITLEIAGLILAVDQRTPDFLMFHVVPQAYCVGVTIYAFCGRIAPERAG